MINVAQERAGQKPARVLWPLELEADESLLSLARRTAHHNLHPHSLVLLRRAGVISIQRPSLAERTDAQVAELALALGIDAVCALYQAPRPRGDGFVEYAGRIYAADLLERRKMRFAPRALACSPYHRTIWDCRTLAYDPETWELLREQCHHCGASQGWRRAQPINHCDACSADLSAAPSVYVDEALRDDLALVNGLLSSDPRARAQAMQGLPDCFAGLAPEVALDVITELLPAVDRHDDQSLFRLHFRTDPQRLIENLAAASRVVRAWPNVRSALEEASQQIGDAARARLRWLEAFAVIERRFGRVLMTPLMDVGRAALDTAPRANRVAKSPKQRPERVEHAINSRELSEMTGLSPREIARYRGQGLLASRKVRWGRGTTIAYDAAEAEHLSEVLKHGLGWEAFAREIGVPRHGIEQLVCLNLLVPSTHPAVVDRRGPLRFGKSELKRFTARFEQEAAPATLRDPIALSEAIHVVPQGLKPWGPVFEVLLEGGVPYAIVSGTGPLSNRLMISRRGLNSIADRKFDRQAYPAFAFAPYTSAREALSELGLQPKALPTLRALGARESRGANKASVPVEAIVRIAADYVTSRELSLRTGEPIIRIGKLLHSAGLRRPPHVGWPRAAAEAAILRP